MLAIIALAIVLRVVVVVQVVAVVVVVAVVAMVVVVVVVWHGTAPFPKKGDEEGSGPPSTLSTFLPL